MSRSDIYLPEPPINVPDGKCPPSITYGFLILFNWNENIKNPFKIFPHRAFNNEIGENCVTKKLTNMYRIKALRPMKSLSGQKLSMFAKVEACKYGSTSL